MQKLKSLVQRYRFRLMLKNTPILSFIVVLIVTMLFTSSCSEEEVSDNQTAETIQIPSTLEEKNQDPAKIKLDLDSIDPSELVMEEDYGFGSKLVDGKPLHLILNKSLLFFKHSNQFDFRITVDTKYKKENELGLPTEEQIDHLAAFDQHIQYELDEQLKCYFAGRKTFDGQRQLSFYTSDADKAKNVMENLKANYKKFDFEYEITEDKGWTKYLEQMTLIAE